VIATASNTQALAATIQRMVDLPDATFTDNTGLIKDCLRDAVRVLEMTSRDLTFKACTIKESADA
jgi:hypothetical protein